MVAGAYAFGSLQQSAAFLALFVTIMVGVLWIIEGFTALFTIGRAGSKILAIVFAIVSIIAGFTLLSSPCGQRCSSGGSSASRSSSSAPSTSFAP